MGFEKNTIKETLESHTTIEFIGECERKAREYQGDIENLKTKCEEKKSFIDFEK